MCCWRRSVAAWTDYCSKSRNAWTLLQFCHQKNFHAADAGSDLKKKMYRINQINLPFSKNNVSAQISAEPGIWRFVFQPLFRLVYQLSPAKLLLFFHWRKQCRLNAILMIMSAAERNTCLYILRTVEKRQELISDGTMHGGRTSVCILMNWNRCQMFLPHVSRR